MFNKVGRQRALCENYIFCQMLVAFLAIATAVFAKPYWHRAQMKALNQEMILYLDHVKIKVGSGGQTVKNVKIINYKVATWW